MLISRAVSAELTAVNGADGPWARRYKNVAKRCLSFSNCDGRSFSLVFSASNDREVKGSAETKSHNHPDTTIARYAGYTFGYANKKHIVVTDGGGLGFVGDFYKLGDGDEGEPSARVPRNVDTRPPVPVWLLTLRYV